MKFITTIFLFIFSFTLSSFACDCMFDREHFNIYEFGNYYDAIFIGKVITIQNHYFDIDSNLMYFDYDITFKVNKIFKGREKEKITLSNVSIDGAACGIEFFKGETVLVYAYFNNRGQLTTDRCTRTSSFDLLERLEKHYAEKADRLRKQGVEEAKIPKMSLNLKKYYIYLDKARKREIKFLDSLAQLQDGKHTFYYEGKIMAEGTMKNGQLSGEWIFYDKKENIEDKGKFKKGFKIGIWENYTFDKAKCRYKKGLKHGKAIYSSHHAVYKEGKLVEAYGKKVMEENLKKY